MKLQGKKHVLIDLTIYKTIYILRMKCLVSKKIAVLCRWGSEKQ